MDIYLRGSTRFLFPFLPSEYTVRMERQTETVSVGKLGDIDLAKGRGLKSITFSSFFPRRYDRGYCRYSGLQSPKACVAKMEKVLRGSPVRLVITGAAVNLSVRLTSFEWKEDDGSGDMTFTATFQEHRSAPVSQSSVIADGGKGGTTGGSGSAAVSGDALAEREASKPAPSRTYTVKKGDTLAGIARRLTGKTDWKALYEANSATIGGDPNSISPGMVLSVPGGEA